MWAKVKLCGLPMTSTFPGPADEKEEKFSDTIIVHRTAVHVVRNEDLWHL